MTLPAKRQKVQKQVDTLKMIKDCSVLQQYNPGSSPKMNLFDTSPTKGGSYHIQYMKKYSNNLPASLPSQHSERW
jgi:uncharacterized iron-regulated membrane protein